MPTRRRSLTSTLFALALLTAIALLAGCGSQQPSGAGGQRTASGDGAGGGEPAVLELEEVEDLVDPVDLPEGVAATVDGEEISEDAVARRFEAVAKLPEVSERLEGEGGEAITEAFRAQIVQNLIAHALVAQSAVEMGLDPSEEDLAAAEDQVIAQFQGDKEEFEEALRSGGATAEWLSDELLFAARIDAIGAEVAADYDAEDIEAPESEDLDPAEAALDEWFAQRHASAEVAVDREYGVWSPEAGEVTPLSAAEGSE